MGARPPTDRVVSDTIYEPLRVHWPQKVLCRPCVLKIPIPETPASLSFLARKVHSTSLIGPSAVHNLYSYTTRVSLSFAGPYAKDVFIIPLDLSDTTQIPRAVELAQNAFDGQGIDYLIHNAAYARPVGALKSFGDIEFLLIGGANSFTSPAKDLFKKSRQVELCGSRSGSPMSERLISAYTSNNQARRFLELRIKRSLLFWQTKSTA